ERFSAHFAGGESSKQSGGAPIIEVSGRTYPVEVRYRPLDDPDHPAGEPKDQVQGICDALAELRAAGPGDVLVFLSGAREIRDTPTRWPSSRATWRCCRCTPGCPRPSSTASSRHTAGRGWS